MDDHTYETWVLNKQLMEFSGRTDSAFYKRACFIVQNRRHPSPEELLPSKPGQDG